ncbi:hypothetical protein AAMO2058_000194500 [Amorphochlora amoebiformis]
MKFLDVDMPKLICLILGIGYLYIPEAYLMGNIVGYPKYNTILITLSDKTSKMTPRTTPHLLWALICVLSAPFSRAESRLNEETSNLSLKTVEERLDDVLRADEGFPAIPSVTNDGLKRDGTELELIGKVEKEIGQDVQALGDLEAQITSALKKSKNIAASDPAGSGNKELSAVLGRNQELRAATIRLQESYGGNECQDKNEGVFEASHGRASTCEEAYQLYKLNDATCEDDLGFGPLKSLCPVTCQVCTPPSTLLDKIDSIRTQVAQARVAADKLTQKVGGTSLTVTDPKEAISQLAVEVKDRFDKGTLFKPLIESFTQIQESAVKIASNLSELLG